MSLRTVILDACSLSKGEILTLATGAAGGLAFLAAGIPGGAISGAVIAVALLSAFGKAHGLGNLSRISGLVIVGVAVGSVAGPDTLSNMAAWPGSLLLMCLCVITMTLVATLIWVWLMRWPWETALLSSVPGTMSYIIAVSLTMRIDAASIAVVHMSRIIFLVTLLPLIIFWESGRPAIAAALPVNDPLWMIAALLIAGALFGWLLQAWGVAGGFLLGGLLISVAAHMSGVAPGRTPDWLMNAGQIILGAWTGSRFADFNWKLFWRILMGVCISIAATMAVSVLFAILASTLFGAPFGAALIGYAPGGFEAMVVLALALGADPIFVTAHHLMRYFLINMTLPLIIARILRKDGGANGSGGN